jgi:hypothetical protein
MILPVFAFVMHQGEEALDLQFYFMLVVIFFGFSCSRLQERPMDDDFNSLRFVLLFTSVVFLGLRVERSRLECDCSTLFM